jgi:hypothetical protein
MTGYILWRSARPYSVPPQHFVEVFFKSKRKKLFIYQAKPQNPKTLTISTYFENV